MLYKSLLHQFLVTVSWAEPDHSQAGGRVSSLCQLGFVLLRYVTLHADSSYEYYYFEVGVNQFDRIAR